MKKYFQPRQSILLVPFLLLFFFLPWREVVFYLIVAGCISVLSMVVASAIIHIVIIKYFQTKVRHMNFFNKENKNG